MNASNKNQLTRLLQRNLMTAQTAISALNAKRLEVLEVDVNRHLPVIKLATLQRNHHELRGVQYRRHSSKQGIFNTFQAMFQGCRVEWEERA